MNILISGGAGFIGGELALKLLEKGHTVTVLDNLSAQIHGEMPEESFLFLKIKDKCRFIHGDVRNISDWKQAIEGQDIIVHYAAETGTGQSMYKINEYVQTNVTGTALLLDLLANEKHAVKKVLVASSRAIYGEGKYLDRAGKVHYPGSRNAEAMQQGIFDVINPASGEKLQVAATDEESKIHPSSVYGITKQNQEDMILSVCKSLGIAAAALRYQNVYGPGQSLKNPYTGILSIFSTLFLNNQAVNIFEDGQMTRDFVYITDVVDATIACIESEKVQNDYFNVGTGQATTVIEVANKLKAIYGSESSITISGNFRIGDIRHNFADMHKIKERIGFETKVSFSEGVALFSEWVKSQEIEKDNGYERSLAEMNKKGLFK
ncbi:MAG: wbiB [Crocinitomicaceae bacterium]|jgi:dTDP-L-rhamnose 4-epimerase|nr:wbiB [Crocinitomicaceae bacterium]